MLPGVYLERSEPAQHERARAQRLALNQQKIRAPTCTGSRRNSLITFFSGKCAATRPCSSGFLTTFYRFESGDRKGGVLTPPQSGSQPPVRLAPPRSLFPQVARGRETGKRLETSVTAGLKPRPCAPESVPGQRGESPLQVDALRPVTERNCNSPQGEVLTVRSVWKATGGERPVRTIRNSIRPIVSGEPARDWRSPDRREAGGSPTS